MNRTMRTVASVGFTTGLAAAMLLAAGTASAQAPAQVMVAPATQPDHDLWVGRIGLGWYGSRGIPVGASTTAFALRDTPLVGARYWINSMIGIDGAVGFFTTSGSAGNVALNGTETSQDTGSSTTFALHAGVPIAIFNMTHYSFQITPELDFGFGTGSGDRSGLLFQVGARGGAEIFFGFMGLPQLSLEASVGLFLSTRNGKTGNTPAEKLSDLTISTVQLNNPWDIFRQNIAARYYF